MMCKTKCFDLIISAFLYGDKKNIRLKRKTIFLYVSVCNSSVSFFSFCWFFQLEILKTGCGWFFLYIYMLPRIYICIVYHKYIYVRSYYDEKHKDAKSSRRSFVFCSSLKSVDFSFHFQFLFCKWKRKSFLFVSFPWKNISKGRCCFLKMSLQLSEWYLKW